MLGRGWFSTDGIVPWVWPAPWSDEPQAILQVTVTHDDGTRQLLLTDDSWKWATGPIRSTYVKFGERYDARLEKPLWNTVGYDDSQWKHAVTVSSPGGRMTSQTMPDMKVKDTLSPTRLTNPKKGVWVFEFDRFFAGWVRLNVKGKPGTTIRMEYSSRILDNGLVDKRGWPGNRQTDSYILKGDPDGEVYEPRFTFHPVRYVQVAGLEERPTLETLMGREVYNDVDMFGNFTCSNELFNQIHKNIERTQKIGFKGLILDCLHREPIAYNEPASVSANLWMRKFTPKLWTKFARDIQLGSSDNGSLSDIVPLLPNLGRRGFDVSQNANYAMLLWYLYQCYDDQRLLEQHYQTVKAWVDCIGTMAESNHVVKKGWLGDHMLPGPAPGQEQIISKETPGEFIWTCFYYHNARTLAKMAWVLGKREDQQHYAGLAEEIKDVINQTWLDPQTGHYASRSQTSEILPLAIGIVPQEHKGKLIESVAKRITEVDGGKLRVGHAGLPGFIESLVDHGMGEIIYNVVNRTDYPGWGYMVSQGATTIWECWGRYHDGAEAESMTMLSGICRFFYNDIAGIGEPDFYGPRRFVPGYGHIVIKPHVLGDLTHASASIRTVRGKISSSWKKNGDALTLEATLPVNSRTEVSVPTMELGNVAITESGKVVWKDGS
jgi:alpha-L-rhamnosidase